MNLSLNFTFSELTLSQAAVRPTLDKTPGADVPANFKRVDSTWKRFEP